MEPVPGYHVNIRVRDFSPPDYVEPVPEPAPVRYVLNDDGTQKMDRAGKPIPIVAPEAIVPVRAPVAPRVSDVAKLPLIARPATPYRVWA